MLLNCGARSCGGAGRGKESISSSTCSSPCPTGQPRASSGRHVTPPRQQHPALSHPDPRGRGWEGSGRQRGGEAKCEISHLPRGGRRLRGGCQPAPTAAPCASTGASATSGTAGTAPASAHVSADSSTDWAAPVSPLLCPGPGWRAAGAGAGVPMQSSRAGAAGTVLWDHVGQCARPCQMPRSRAAVPPIPHTLGLVLDFRF